MEISLVGSQDLDALECFDIYDIREITKKLETFKNKVTKRKVDYEELIRFEMAMLRQMQVHVPRDHPRRKDCEALLMQHISKIFTLASNHYKEDMCFWSLHLKFLDRTGLPNMSTARKMMEMLHLNNRKPLAWKVAADWEHKHKRNIKNARQLLLRGLRFNPESRLLYTEVQR